MGEAQQELQQAGGELAERHDVDPILVMIQSAARDPEADVDKMERLMAMYERQQEKHSEAAFNKALNASQRDLTRIAADATNPQTRSRYATYAALDRAIRPVYTKHGFSLSFDTGDTDKPETVRIICHVSHESGHTRSYHADMPADGKGAKGNAMMTATHATGSAMSYGMRYLLKLIFNVAIGEDDDDGNRAGRDIETISQEEADALDRVADKVEGGAKRLREYLHKRFGSADPINIPAKEYKSVLSVIERNAKNAA